MNVSVKALILQNDRILLLKPKCPKNSIGGWDGPGGTVKENESFLEALKREICEETGLKLKTAIPLATIVPPNHSPSYLIFLCTTKKGKITLSGEHIEYKWVTPQQLYKITKYDLLKELKKIKKTIDGFLFSFSSPKL